MATGLEPLVVFWIGRGIHITVLLSFAVQVTLLLLADIRRRADWPVLKVIIWSAYMMADMTAIYALGHLSVVATSPDHRLMVLWAPLLLVHLGGQDNITAYAIEDNRLWLRHLQTFGVQVLAAGYVLYASSILFRPSFLRSATILMSVVGVLKYGERVWALMGADSSASSSLSATSYKHFGAEQADDALSAVVAASQRDGVQLQPEVRALVVAYSLLDVPKQMFEGPTRYVKIENATSYEGKFMLEVVEMQLTMMYDLLYTKAAVIHTWYGFFVRVISLPFTVTALQLFHALSDNKDGHSRVDVHVTNVLLTGAVLLETMSVLKAVFSMWTAALLYKRKWYTLGRVVQFVELLFFIWPMMILARREGYWSGHMRQHGLFKVFYHTDYSTGSKIAKRMGREDLWDSTYHSWSTRVQEDTITKVLELVSTTQDGQIDIKESRGLNALKRGGHEELAWSVYLDLDESILVWHIATNVYLEWCHDKVQAHLLQANLLRAKATRALCNYMFFLLAARPYMLPYPVTRQRYVQLCHDSITHLRCCSANHLLRAILDQKEDLIKGSPLKPDHDRNIVGVSASRGSINTAGDNGTARPSNNHTAGDRGTAQPSVNRIGNRATAQPSINGTFDRGCQLAAKLLHAAADGADAAERGRNAVGILKMIFEVWVEMLCYTAYCCNEKSHAKNLTNGGEIMTIVAFIMVYMSNGFITKTMNKRGGTCSA